MLMRLDSELPKIYDVRIWGVCISRLSVLSSFAFTCDVFEAEGQNSQTERTEYIIVREDRV